MNKQTMLSRTKIVATLGPSSSSTETIKALLELGVRVFRLNFSHGTHHSHQDQIKKIRELEDLIEEPVGIMVDLQGRKIRLGQFKDGEAHVQTGDVFTLDQDKTLGDVQRVYLPHSEIFTLLNKGDSVLIDDGKVPFRVIETTPTSIKMEVLQAGTLSDHKGVSMPSKCLVSPILTPKDVQDLEFALTQDIDWIALSYIQSSKDVQYARDIIGERAGIIAKIEHPGALEDLEAIISATEGVMIARGDLGVEINPEEVPISQRRIIKQARQEGKPVIVATQMLGSMVESAIPTRAEVSDVATAVYQGADCLMLSGETANGAWPIQSVDRMRRIILRTQEERTYSDTHKEKDMNENPLFEGIAQCVRLAAERMEIKAILNYTNTGRLPRDSARKRPKAPILALSPFVKVARQLTLVWGIFPYVVPSHHKEQDAKALALSVALEGDICKKGDLLILSQETSLETEASSTLLEIVRV